jgi:hypothetical protein
VEWGLYCENFIIIGLTADAGDYFKNRATIPLAPCIPYFFPQLNIFTSFLSQARKKLDQRENYGIDIIQQAVKKGR